jgi:DNA-binding MarR family transcriptional regulator
MRHAIVSSADLLAACACTRARTAARLITRAYDEALRPAGLTAAQLAVLAAIDSIEVASIAALSKTLFMDRTTLSRNLKPILAAGLIAMEEGPGRSKSVTITKAGEKALRSALPLWQHAQQALAHRFGADRMRGLHQQLERLIAAH